MARSRPISRLFATAVPCIGVGPAVPQNVEVESVIPASLKVTWALQTDHDVVIKYQMVGSCDWQQDLVPNENSLHYISGLVPNKDYSICMACRSSIGLTGRYCKIVNCKSGQDVPTAPVKLSLDEATSNTVTLTWSSPVSPNGEITEYRLQYKSANETRFSTLTVTDESCTLTELTANEKYEVKVAAVNEAGCGPYTDITTAHTSPVAPTDVKVRMFSADTVQVTWCPSSSTDITGYLISYTTGDLTQTVLVDETATIASLHKLKMKSIYSIIVQSVSKNKKSDWSNERSLTTYVPDNVAVEGVTPASLKVSWILATDHDVVIEYKMVDSSDWKSEAVSSGTTTHTISGLVPHEDYSVQVACMSSSGVTGSFCETVNCKSGPDVPTTPVKLSLDEATSNTVKLSWPSPVSPNGEISEYRLQYKSALERQFSTISVTDEFCTITELTANEKYEVKVAAVNEVGCGSYTDITSVHTSPVAPTDVKVRMFSADAVQVTWCPSSSTDITGYLISYTTGDVSQTVQVDETATNASIHKLKVNSIYSITVQSVGKSRNSGRSNEIMLTSYVPENVALERVTPASLKVSWTLSTDHDIVIYYKMVDSSDCKSETVTSGRTTHIISGLVPHEDYSVQVACMSSSGVTGAFCKTVNCKSGPDVPTAPVKLSLDKATSNTVKLSWPSPVSPNGEVTEYRLQYKRALETRFSTITVTDEFCTLNELTANEKYEVKVAAVNEVGCGPYTDITTVHTSPVAPTNVEVRMLVDTVQVTWCPSSSTDITGYLISYTTGDVTQTVQVDETATIASLHKLKVSSIYSIAVQAVSNSRKSDKSNEILLPTYVPDNVALEGVTPASLKVSWTLSTDHDVVIYYKMVDSSDWISEAVSSGTTTHIISGLVPHEDYSVQVAFMSSSGVTGAFCETVNCKSGPDVPTAPVKLSLDEATRNTVTLSWSSPVSPNGEITEYRLQYKSVNESRFSTLTVTDEFCTINELTANEKHEVKVAAVNEVGCGPYTDITPVHTSKSVPQSNGDDDTIIDECDSTMDNFEEETTQPSLPLTDISSIKVDAGDLRYTVEDLKQLTFDTIRKCDEKDENEAELVSASVQLLLITVNDIEFYATLYYMAKGDIPKSLTISTGTRFFLGKYANIPTALVQLLDQGILPCSNVVSAALNKFRKLRAIVLVGVCAIFGNLGDVVVSTQIVGCDHLKHGKDKMINRSPTANVGSRLLRFLKAQHAWRFNCNKDGKPVHYSTQHFKPVLSAPILLANQKSRNEYRKFCPEALGFEMEGIGAMNALRESDKSNVELVVVKAGCDHADESKSKEWQPVAAMAAADFVYHQFNQRPVHLWFRAATVIKQPSFNVDDDDVFKEIDPDELRFSSKDLEDQVSNILVNEQRDTTDFTLNEIQCSDVKLLLLTVKDCEFNSSLHYLAKSGTPKSYTEIYAIRCFVGKFAGIPAAVVQHGSGSSESALTVYEALNTFTNIQAIISVGVCAGFGKLGDLDVIVSSKIVEHKQYQGRKVNTHYDISPKLLSILKTKCDWVFNCTKSSSKHSTVHFEPVLSLPLLIQAKRDGLKRICSEALGYEMEGLGVIKLHEELQDRHFIIVKTGCGNNYECLNEDLLPTAAMAAADFVFCHLNRETVRQWFDLGGSAPHDEHKPGLSSCLSKAKILIKHAVEEEPEPDVPNEVLQSVSVLLLTVNKNEHLAARYYLQPFDDHEHVFRFQQRLDYGSHQLDVTEYYLGKYGACSVAIRRIPPGSARHGASTAPMKARKCFPNLAAVIAVGIARGVETKVNLYDILVSTKVIKYDSASIHKSGGEIISGSSNLQEFFTSQVWNPEAELIQDLQEKPKINCGTLLSHTEGVEMSQELINRYAPIAIGSEMEGAYLFTAAQPQKIQGVIVKSVSLFVDKKRNEGVQNTVLTASLLAANYVHAVLSCPQVHTKIIGHKEHSSRIIRTDIRSFYTGVSRQIGKTVHQNVLTDPKELHVSNATSSTVTLSWLPPDSSIETISEYQIHYKRTNQKVYDKLTVNGDSKGYTVVGLKAGVTYLFKVAAVNEAGCGYDSNIITVTTKPSVGAEDFIYSHSYLKIKGDKLIQLCNRPEFELFRHEKQLQVFCDSVKLLLVTSANNEFLAVLQHMAKNEVPKTVRMKNDIRFFIGKYANTSTALVQLLKPGYSQSNLVAKEAIERFSNLKAIMSVGVCTIFGNLGDVIVATKVVRCEDNKCIGEKRSPVKQSSVTDTSSVLLYYLKADDWKFTCTKSFPDPCLSQVYYKPILSGSESLAKKEKREEYRQLNLDAMGFEKDGIGILDALHDYDKKNINFIIVKAGCNHGDEAKYIDWQPVAAIAAAQFVYNKLDQEPFRHWFEQDSEINTDKSASHTQTEVKRKSKSFAGFEYLPDKQLTAKRALGSLDEVEEKEVINQLTRSPLSCTNTKDTL